MAYLLNNQVTDTLNPSTVLTRYNVSLKNPDGNNIFNIATNYSWTDQAGSGTIVTNIVKSGTDSTVSN